MRQRPENFNPAGGDPEATLVAPRFDDEEARRAHPVVPLAAAHAPYAGARARRDTRLSWPPALLAVALLAAVAVGAVASMVLRRTPSNPPAAAAPARAADAPAQVEPPTAAPAPREVADTRPAPRVTRNRRAEDAPVRAHVEWEDSDDRDEDRRGKRGGRRERREDEAEKEMRKVLKRAKDKAPRLVDVLVNPQD